MTGINIFQYSICSNIHTSIPQALFAQTYIPPFHKLLRYVTMPPQEPMWCTPPHVHDLLVQPCTPWWKQPTQVFSEMDCKGNYINYHVLCTKPGHWSSLLIENLQGRGRGDFSNSYYDYAIHTIWTDSHFPSPFPMTQICLHTISTNK